MPSRKEHDDYCKSKGISPKVCEKTNEWIDAPAKDGGGCTHREQRHRTIDCLKWAASNPRESRERYAACQAHREADRKADKCGSTSLQE